MSPRCAHGTCVWNMVLRGLFAPHGLPMPNGWSSGSTFELLFLSHLCATQLVLVLFSHRNLTVWLECLIPSRYSSTTVEEFWISLLSHKPEKDLKNNFTPSTAMIYALFDSPITFGLENASKSSPLFSSDSVRTSVSGFPALMLLCKFIPGAETSSGHL